MPSLRPCSGGPPPSAIHGRGRLPRHPCRGAPYARPAFSLWFTGHININIKSQINSYRGGLVADLSLAAVHRSHCRSEPALGGIPTMAVCQATSSSTDTTPSSGCRPEQAHSHRDLRSSELCAAPNSQVGYKAASAAGDAPPPPRGRVEVLRSGQPGMDAGLAAAGHGWPMAAGPRSRTGARACRA